MLLFGRSRIDIPYGVEDNGWLVSFGRCELPLAMPKRNIIWILVAGVIALLLWRIPEGAVRRDALYTQFGPLLDVRVQVLQHYVEPVEEKQQLMLKGAINGMLTQLDPYCVYFTTKEYDLFNKRASGQFNGIGVEVERLPGEGLQIISPIEGSPAFQAGLRASDRITAIDGINTSSKTLEESVALIMGHPGTSVTLTLFRPSTEEIFERTITRCLITVRSVRGWARSDDWQWDYLIDPEQQIGYVRISGFERVTNEQFDDVLRDLIGRQRMRGLVLDLRDNSGGLMDTAVSIANKFIHEGNVIVSTRNRVGSVGTYLADGKDLYPDFPMAVLINHGSASAAEILAGALRDHKRATLVGERSFGKGSVQDLIQLENGSGAIKLTTAYYYLPNGERIHGHGIAPDRVVDLTSAERKELAESLLAVYSTSTKPTSLPATQSSSSSLPESQPTTSGSRAAIMIDRQLKSALDVVRQQLATQPKEISCGFGLEHRTIDSSN